MLSKLFSLSLSLTKYAAQIERARVRERNREKFIDNQIDD
jgi:hypothetical protein